MYSSQNKESKYYRSQMATLVPPPSKRQKIAALEKAEKAVEDARIPEDLGSVRVQFVDQSTGKTTGPVVAVPVKDATVKNLETLLNTLQGNVSSVGRKRLTIQADSSYRNLTNDYPTAFSSATIVLL